MEAQHQYKRPYMRLAIMTVLSFVAMFALMYAMVDRFANIYPNLNQAYMATLMAAPMVAIEVVLMASMYPNKRTNALILAGSKGDLGGLLDLAVAAERGDVDGIEVALAWLGLPFEKLQAHEHAVYAWIHALQQSLST